MFKRREPITQADRDWNQMMDPRVQKDRVDYVLDYGKDLSTWELDFLNNLSQRLIKGYELSEKQAEVLEKLYHKID